MKKLKIAIVGVGSISRTHIDGYLKNPDVELCAFCDINEARLQYMGEKYGITRLYTDEAKMLEEIPELDAVSVCTWNSAHAPCTIMALNAGKHVLCEKPMAMNTQEAIEMMETATRNGKLLMIGFVRRFGKDADIVNDFVKAGRLGELYYAKAVTLRRNGNPGGWFGEKARSGGGPLIDLGVHVIDLTRYLAGKPRVESVYGATFHKLGARNNVKTPKPYVSVSATDHDICDCEDLASAMLRFENGFVMSVEMSYSLNLGKGDNSVQLFGTQGGVHLSTAEGVKLYSEMDGYLSNTTFDGRTSFDNDAYDREMNNFVDAILGRAECRNPAEDGVEIMRILDAIYRSAETGHEEVIVR